MITNPDNWFAHFATDGRIVSGSGAVYAEGQPIAAPAWQVRWIRPGSFIWNSGADTRIASPPGTNRLHASAFAVLAAGNGQWAGWNEQGVFLNGQLFDPTGDQPWISREGHFVYKTDRQSNVHAIVYNGQRITPEGPLINPRCEGGGVVWSEHLSQYVLATRGWRGTSIDDLRVIEDSEIESVPIPTPDGLYVLTLTHWGFFIRPWGSKEGWVYHGDCYTPDAICLDGVIHVTGWSGTQGRGLLLRFPLDAPRAAIRTPQAQPVPAPPSPPDSAAVPPPPAVEPPAVTIPNHFDVVHAIDRANPHLTQRNTRVSIREFYWRSAWALHQHDANWGMLTVPEGAEHHVIEDRRVSVDRVSYQGSSAVVDIISGAGDGPGKARLVWAVDEHCPAGSVWTQPPPFRTQDDEAGEAAGMLALVRALRDELAALRDRCAALEDATLRYGSRAALSTEDGHVLTADAGGGGALSATGTSAGPSETFTLGKP